MESSSTNREVTVIDVKMPFWSMVIFMIKWAIASIPALIILAVLWLALAGFSAGLLRGFGA